MVQTYHPPVAQLLQLGESQSTDAETWPNYPEQFGLTTEQIPELLQLMQDEALLNLNPDEVDANFPPDLDPEQALWAPLHAWRALGQLQAVQLVDGMGAVLTSESMDWAFEEFPQVCQLLGVPALEPLATALQEHLAADMIVAGLVDCLVALAQKYPELRDRVIAVLSAPLATAEANAVPTNSHLVSGLLELKAIEQVDLLETLFQAQQVDEFFLGTWASAQIDLGLKTKADFTEADLTPRLPPEIAKFRNLMEEYQRQRKPSAYAAGLPLDWEALSPSQPTSFEDLLAGRSSHLAPDKKGFGGAKSGQKKKKKKS